MAARTAELFAERDTSGDGHRELEKDLAADVPLVDQARQLARVEQAAIVDLEEPRQRLPRVDRAGQQGRAAGVALPRVLEAMN